MCWKVGGCQNKYRGIVRLKIDAPDEMQPPDWSRFLAAYLPSADSRALLLGQKAQEKRRCEQAAAAFARRTSEGGASGTGRREV
jgi:hypothetical protein